MRYGHFSKDNREYIITNPNTPRPWINYLTNEEYCLIISQCAGGYSFYRDCGANRITRWQPGYYLFDRPGKYVFLKDKASRKTWSATYQPLRVKPQSYKCRHGLGYTTIHTKYNGIEAEITYFVPEGQPCEIWQVKLTNKTNRKKTILAYPYIEWLIGDYQMELGYRNILNLYNLMWYDKASGAIMAKKTASWGDFNIRPAKYTAFFWSSLAKKHVATRKNEFLGRYNNEESPAGILESKFRDSRLTSGEDGIGCFEHEVALPAKKTKTFTVILGQSDSKANIKKVINRFKKLSAVKKALKETKDIWVERICANMEVDTPDKDFNALFNVWCKYQLYICNYWSRSPSFYHEGSGGRGYRDSCQDADSICTINPKHTLEKIKKIASVIREDGTSAPNWSEERGPEQNRPCKDHPIWLTATVAGYIKETGDFKILDKKLPYLKDKWLGGWHIDHKFKGAPTFKKKGTLYEHLYKNLDFTFNDTGRRGLPLIGHADWNDGIDAAGKELKGESVWLAQALVRSLKMLAELSDRTGRKKEAATLKKRATIMTDRINKVGWDGKWYKRGFTDSGFTYGSAKNKEGKIFLNTQSWAVLAGITDKKKDKLIAKSIDKHLDGKYGLALFSPAYSEFDGRLGKITMFSEGTKENAAVFCHAVTFMAVAECLLGRGNEAYRDLRKIMPNAQDNYDRYMSEPYAFAEYLIGPDHPYRYGEGAFTWITGTAGWAYMSATEWILGIRRDYEGLRIDPCLPKKWKKIRVKRPFRKARYDIIIENKKGAQAGVKEILVDGKRIEGNLIRPHKDNKTHKVKVIMS